MQKTKLINFLAKTFSATELSVVSEAEGAKEISIEPVTDLVTFLKECETETHNVKVAGAHRLLDWEKGWAGDGVYRSSDEYDNLPFYFRKNTHVRIAGEVYRDTQGFVEVDVLRVLQRVVLSAYLPEFGSKAIFEYGCGTGSNIQYLRKHFPSIEFFGSDWAVSACTKLVENKVLPTENVFRVDYFDPSSYVDAGRPFVAFTNVSLEQAGRDYGKFMDYLFANPRCVGGIHIEPVRELLDLTLPLNRQSYEYAARRGYLTDFVSFLARSPIDVLCAKDYGIGSKYISNYQVVCWKNRC